MPNSYNRITNLVARVRFTFIIMMMVGVANIVSALETPIDFTPQEKAYIAKTGAISMCINPDWVPFESINKLGQHEGSRCDRRALCL